MEQSEFSCCLCRSEALEKRKRKRFHGASCLKAKIILQRISDVPLDYLVQTSNPDAVLCITCEQQLLNIRKAEEKLKLLQYEVSEKLKSLTHRISQERHRKRQHVTKDSIHPQSKRTSTQILDPLTTSVSEEYHGAFDDGDRDVHQPNDDTRATEPGECVSTSGTAQATDTMETTPGNKMPLLVTVPYKDHPLTYSIHTPSCRGLVRRATRKNFVAMSSGLVTSGDTCKQIVSQIGIKIKSEMKDISSVTHNSILKNSCDAIKDFNWDIVMDELLSNLPTLMSLLMQLIPKPMESKPLLCILASQILKSRYSYMGLVQRVLSVMLYGNGTAKMVYLNLRPLNLCLSYQQTMRIVQNISSDHDSKVIAWRKDLYNLMEKPSSNPVHYEAVCSADAFPDISHSDPDSELSDDLSDCSDISVVGTAYSLITDGELSDRELSENEIEEFLDDTVTDNVLDVSREQSVEESQTDEGEFDYKCVIDNIDKNVIRTT